MNEELWDNYIEGVYKWDCWDDMIVSWSQRARNKINQ